MIAVDLSDAFGGAVVALITVAVAFFGWLGTRGTTASSTAEWLVKQLRTEIEERDGRIDHLEIHVRQCEADHAVTSAKLDKAEEKIDRIFLALRRVMTVEEYAKIVDDLEGG